MCEMTLSLPADPESEGEAAEKDNGALPKERMGASVVQPSSADPRLSKIKDAAANHSKEMTTASDVATDNDFIKQLDKMVEDLSKARQRPLTPLQEIYRKQHKFEGLRLRRFKLDYLKELSAWNKKVRESGLSRLFSKVLRKPTPSSLEYANALRTQFGLFEDSLREAIKRDLTPSAFPDFSYMRKGLEMWHEAVTPPPLTLDALEKYVSEVREATDAFSDFKRHTAELAKTRPRQTPDFGVRTVMQKVKVSLAYVRTVRQLQVSTKKIETILDEAYKSSRPPDDTPSLADAVTKFKESLRGPRTTPVAPKKSVDKKPPAPPPPPPPPPPGGGGDDNGDKRPLKPEYQIAATTISADIEDSLQKLLSIAIDMSFRRIDTFKEVPNETKVALKNEILDNMRDMLPTLGLSGRDSVYQEINGRLSKLEQCLERAESKGVKINVKSTKAIVNGSAGEIAARLKRESLVRPTRKFFADPKKMTDKQKQQHDIQVIWGIQRLDANSTTSSTFGIEEAARRAENAGLLIWYKTAHSASVSYRKLKNSTLPDKWHEIAGCLPNDVAEIKARLDKYESGN